MNLDGKVAVVVGGAGGIGLAIVDALLQKGAKVCIADIHGSKAAASALAAKYGRDNVAAFDADVTSENQVEALFGSVKSRFGTIDIVSLHAGMLNEETWKDMLKINVESAVSSTYKAVNYMSKCNNGNGGVVVITASVAGIVSFAHCPVYAASKAAVITFVRQLAENDYYRASRTGVRYLAMCPTFTDTTFVTDEAVHQATAISNNKECNDSAARKFIEDRDTYFIKPEAIGEAFVEMVENDKLDGNSVCVQRNGSTVYEPPNFVLATGK